jgi:predicted amidohydrolase YtcJ
MTSPTTIFSARRIVTMNPARPQATHVAVRDGRILMTGSLEDMRTLPDAAIDARFANKILLPGFVEGHAHVMEGTLWSAPYVGAFERRAPDGKRIAGLTTIDAVVERLKAAVAARADESPSGQQDAYAP